MAVSQELPLLTGRKLEKSFASRQLFKDLSFGIPQKAKIGLVGANGAGKSTLLKIIAGLVRPDGGEVTSGRGVRIALLDQDATFPAEQTVREAFVAALEAAGIEPYDARPLKKTDQILSQLSLSPLEDKAIGTLSGGWKRRVQLGAALVTEPDLLLLDEPTNHLDTDGILWLEDFLTESNVAFVLISHDRLFLTRTVEFIYELDHRHPNGILVVEGSFATYLERKAELMAGLGEREKKLANRLRRETEWLRRGAKARQTKQKARIENAGELSEEVGRLKLLNRKNRLNLTFDDGGRAPEKLVVAKELSKIFTTPEGELKELFADLDLLITSRSRVGLLGRNGCGKTTLIRTLTGKELPTTGKIVLADKLRVVHFEQGRDSINPELSLLKNLAPDGDSVMVQGRPMNAKGYISKFNFRSEQADLPAGRLSGGERARLRIAQILLEPASLLILDEPTNDLDFDTLEVLEEALDEYSGAVLVVSHDRTFLDNVTDELWAFGTPDAPKLRRYASYLQYEMDRASWTEVKPGARGAAYSTSSMVLQAVTPTKAGKLSFKEKFEFDQMEKAIALAEAKLAELETSVGQNSAQTQSSLYAKLAEQQGIIEKMYARWAELETKLKGTS
jgi:ATP-binding cassette subfamily F protein uup